MGYFTDTRRLANAKFEPVCLVWLPMEYLAEKSGKFRPSEAGAISKFKHYTRSLKHAAGCWGHISSAGNLSRRDLRSE